MDMKEMFEKGVKCFDQEKYEESLVFFKKIINEDPKCSKAYIKLGISLQCIERYDESLKSFENALNIDKSFEAYFGKGLALYYQEDDKNAQISFEDALKLKDDLWAFYYNGSCFLNLGEYKKAIEFFEKAINIDSNNPLFWNDKGVSFNRIGQNRKALACYDEALKLESGYALSMINKAYTFRDLKKYPESLFFFDEYLKIERDNLSALYGKGDVLASIGNQQKALECFKKLVQLDPESYEAWDYKGFVEYNLRNYSTAKKSLDKAIELNPEFDESYYDLGRVYRELKDYKNALKQFDKAIEINPNYVSAWFEKGNVLRDMGEENKSIGAYECYVKLAEENDSEDKLWASRVKEYIKYVKNKGKPVVFDKKRKTQYWQWSTKPEYFLEADGSERVALDPTHNSDPGGWWTCHKDTKAGDLILLYRAGQKRGKRYMDIKYLIQATSDSYPISDYEVAIEQGWDYGCDYKPLFKFKNPLTLSEIRQDPYLDDWNALNALFRRAAYRTEKRHWERLESLLKEKNQDYNNYLKTFEPKKIIGILKTEKEVEDKLEARIDILKKFGYDLNIIGRQVICQGPKGRIDLLCRDKTNDTLVILELKVVPANRTTFGQISEYMGWAITRMSSGEPVKGVVISKGYDNSFKSALSTNKDIQHLELSDVLNELGMKLN